MPNNFRNSAPTRTCTKTYAEYRSFKDHLAKDFNSRCGYTDCSDFWFGGKGTFHIDHFIPWKKYKDTRPELKVLYSNLVYACSYVNIAKSDDEGDYLDPCDHDYNKHFERDDLGFIIPKPNSPHALYMYTKLKLYLRRYQIIWMLDALQERMLALQRHINKMPDSPLKIDLKVMQADLSENMLKYMQYLKAEQ